MMNSRGAARPQRSEIEEAERRGGLEACPLEWLPLEEQDARAGDLEPTGRAGADANVMAWASGE